MTLAEHTAAIRRLRPCEGIGRARPPNVSQVRAVITIIDWSLGPTVYADAAWRTLSEQLQSCLLLVAVRDEDAMTLDTPVDQVPVRNAAIGGADGLFILLEDLAKQSGHAELANAKLLLWGQSAAGSFVVTFAALYPGRTIGFVRYHSHSRELPVDIETTAQIPGLLLAGETDETAGVEDTLALWRRGRVLGAPWTFGIEPGASHRSLEHLAHANRVAIPWVSAVFQLRMQGDVTLSPIAEHAGWLANLQSGAINSCASFSGVRQEASWLPDEATALGWQAVTSLAQ